MIKYPRLVAYGVVKIVIIKQCGLTEIYPQVVIPFVLERIYISTNGVSHYSDF